MSNTICATCGATFIPKRGRARAFCSSECYYNRKGGRVTELRSCEVCGTNFWPEDSAHSGDYRQRACSNDCAAQLRRRGAPQECAWCGGEFYVKRTETHRRVCCSRKCSAQLREKQHRDNWVSGVRGRYVGSNGYAIIHMPPGERDKHSSRDERGRIMEHRYVMECHLGRPLKRHEVVHHKNGDRADNRLENLELWSQAHPPTQRVTDLIAFARNVLATYEESQREE